MPIKIPSIDVRKIENKTRIPRRVAIRAVNQGQNLSKTFIVSGVVPTHASQLDSHQGLCYSLSFVGRGQSGLIPFWRLRYILANVALIHNAV